MRIRERDAAWRLEIEAGVDVDDARLIRSK
jgi:hypothetical protein